MHSSVVGRQSCRYVSDAQCDNDGSARPICVQFQPAVNVGDTLVTVGGKNVYGLSLTTLRYMYAVLRHQAGEGAVDTFGSRGLLHGN